MKKLSKLFLMGAIALGLAACNNEDVPNTSPVEGDSWASVTIKFPKGATLKAGLPGDYNEKGEYGGRDVIETVDVFLVGAGAVNYSTFTKSSFAEIDNDGILKPNLALTATADQNIRVYAVVNGHADIIAALKSTPAGGFAAAFADVAEKNASDVASFIGATKKEKVMMTNDADTYVITVAAGVTKEEAMDPAQNKNHAQVNVDRVVSRALLTVAPLSGDNWTVKVEKGITEEAIATVKGVTYAVGQSNKKFYIMKKSNYEVPENVYSYVPSISATPGSGDWYTTGQGYFDYTGLADVNFTAVQEFSYPTAPTAVGAALKTPLDAEETSKFVLPVNHAVDGADAEAQRPFYKKGNTTYMEIRATFVPLKLDDVDYTGDPTTVYLGANDNKFYSTKTAALAQGQQVTEYVDGVMKYIIWLNPIDLVATPAAANPMVSPTVRNQIYHAHINAFKRMGVPNNPLNPTDPNNPDPTDPEDPDTPKNPIDPEDPLKTDVTYLSVSVKVMPWTIHSYGINLGENMY